jgi:hypothetical protein
VELEKIAIPAFGCKNYQTMIKHIIFGLLAISINISGKSQEPSNLLFNVLTEDSVIIGLDSKCIGYKIDVLNVTDSISLIENSKSKQVDDNGGYEINAFYVDLHFGIPEILITITHKKKKMYITILTKEYSWIDLRLFSIPFKSGKFEIDVKEIVLQRYGKDTFIKDPPSYIDISPIEWVEKK